MELQQAPVTPSDLQSCLTRPLDVVRQIYSSNAGDNSDGGTAAVQGHFTKLLATSSSLQQVLPLQAYPLCGFSVAVVLVAKLLLPCFAGPMLNPQHSG
jgi:hypothetical protein